MKKLPVLPFASLLVATLLPACGPALDCADEDVFCVGLVTEAGKIDDHSLNQPAWEGVQRAEKELGAYVQYIGTTDAMDYAKNIATFGEEDYDVIVTAGFSLGEATVAAAETYSGVDFIGVDQFQAETVDGVAGLNFPEDRAGFLVGALAAAMTKSQKIGAACATDADPAVWRFGEGYRAGAAYLDQYKAITTEVLVVYHSDLDPDKSFADPEWGASTARSMIAQGADVIFGCGGITGESAIVVAAEADAYAIGVNTDQYLALPEAAPRILSSAMKLITPGVFELIKLSKEGNFPSGNYLGHATYAPYHDLESEIPVAVKRVMEQINAGLLDGSIQTNVPPVKP